MIHLISGLTGSGKSAYLARMAVAASAQGNAIWSYFKFQLKGIPNVHYWKKLTDITQLDHCLVLMDEATIWLNSRKWDLLPEEFLWAMNQERKSGIDLWAACQNANRIDTAMREVVHHYFEIRRIAGTKIETINGKDVIPKWPWQLSWIREWDIMRRNNVTRDSGAYGIGRPLLFLEKDFTRFDTLAKWADYKSDDPDFAYSEVQVRTCKHCGARKTLY